MNAFFLEEIYARYNLREFTDQDPIAFLYRYRKPKDREIAGLIASSLAYGRVAQILASVESVLRAIGSPSECLSCAGETELKRMVRGLKHRFTSGEEIGALLVGARRVVAEHGSLGACFASGVRDEDETVLPALDAFASALAEASGHGCPSLIPRPSRGSACKKLNLYVRWMVRADVVDPGGWTGVSPSRLIVPLDTHMHRFALASGLTARRSADMRTAIEITRGFARFAPEDPVKYDFALTRPGILGLDLPMP